MKSNKSYPNYDSTYKPTKKDIEKFPDLQNGPSSLIQVLMLKFNRSVYTILSFL